MRHKHISNKTVDELGECFLIAAQGAPLEPLAPPGERGTPVCERPLRNVRQFRHPHRRPNVVKAVAGLRGVTSDLDALGEPKPLVTSRRSIPQE